MTEFKPQHFINRELSWLEFNQRVLEEAWDQSNPLFERLKFFTIFSTNLDEFFEVRVSGLKQQIESQVAERSLDGLTAAATFQAVTRRIRRMVARQYQCWREELSPGLAAQGHRFLDMASLSATQQAWVERYYATQVRPVLTPLAVDPAHPFPLLLNKSLNLIVQLEPRQERNRLRLAIVQLPRVLPRLVRLPRKGQASEYLSLGRLIGHYLSDLFSGAPILGYWRFRVTRNSELYIDEEEAANLLKAVENELHKRRRGDAVRLEVQRGCPKEIRSHLLKNLRLSEADLYAVDGPLNPHGLLMIVEDNPAPELRDPPFIGRLLPLNHGAKDWFEAIRRRDILLHHPYDNFEAVMAFLEAAAADPQVLAIKQTFYRTGSDTRLVEALMKAVTNGKQVTVVVELKARFDEEKNIEWARRLEQAGVHVVYGLVGYKIHGKICLVVRHEAGALQRYVHLSTGNYNPITTRVYTDLGLFTCHPDFGEDATNLFNLLTGICQFQGMRKLLVAPFELHEKMLALIQRELEHARQGLPARILAKMNALADREIIEALYRASEAGVRIDLIVRGLCCLRPQLKGVSQNITVRSILDRFLEHSRVFYFENACQPEVYISSADWMPRNFFGRIEMAFPVEDGILRERIIQEILALPLADNVKARWLQANGSYGRMSPKPGEAAVRSQLEFIKLVQPPHAASPAARPKSKTFPKVKLAPPPGPGLAAKS